MITLINLRIFCKTIGKKSIHILVSNKQVISMQYNINELNNKIEIVVSTIDIVFTDNLNEPINTFEKLKLIKCTINIPIMDFYCY